MKKSFKKEVGVLVLLCLLPLAALPIANRIRIEQIAQKDIAIGCSPDEGEDCWPLLVKTIMQNPHTYRFRARGGYQLAQNIGGEDIIYDRKRRILHYENYSRDENHEFTHIIICADADDDLLRAFLTETDPAFYSTFDHFCRAKGRKVHDSWK